MPCDWGIACQVGCSEGTWRVDEPVGPGMDGYQILLRELKLRIRTARLQAALAVNHELNLLYWGIGREILERQAREGWGSRVIDRLSADLRRDFPDMTGLSARNLKYMRALRGSPSRPRICATGCCTIAVGSRRALRHSFKRWPG